MVAFHAVTPERAVELARMRASSSARYFAALAARAAMPAGMVVAAG
jgi:hypothetical protein